MKARTPAVLELEMLDPFDSRSQKALLAVATFLGKCSAKRIYIPLIIKVRPARGFLRSDRKKFPSLSEPTELSVRPFWDGLRNIKQVLREWTKTLSEF